MPAIARLGDPGSHGGGIVTASANVTANGIRCARLGDIYGCPVHGPNPIVAASRTVTANAVRLARVDDVTACGARIEAGSPNANAGG
jgi:uncharacterized Zn-binding protein involved in type VI secretion